jgi:hypothetical protein
MSRIQNHQSIGGADTAVQAVQAVIQQKLPVVHVIFDFVNFEFL